MQIALRGVLAYAPCTSGASRSIFGNNNRLLLGPGQGHKVNSENRALNYSSTAQNRIDYVNIAFSGPRPPGARNGGTLIKSSISESTRTGPWPSGLRMAVSY